MDAEWRTAEDFVLSLRVKCIFIGSSFRSAAALGDRAKRTPPDECPLSLCGAHSSLNLLLFAMQFIALLKEIKSFNRYEAKIESFMFYR